MRDFFGSEQVERHKMTLGREARRDDGEYSE
jgi:hypothetical protein